MGCGYSPSLILNVLFVTTLCKAQPIVQYSPKRSDYRMTIEKQCKYTSPNCCLLCAEVGILVP